MPSLPIALSPTTLAKAYDLSCPRYLIWSTDDVPREKEKWEKTPGGRILADLGNSHEEMALTNLTEDGAVLTPEYPHGDLDQGARITRELIESGCTFLSQAVFSGEVAPGIKLRGLADLVRDLRNGISPGYQIVEIKFSLKIKTSQMLQAAVYDRLLSHIVPGPRPDPVVIDRFQASHETPMLFFEPILNEFLEITIPSWLAQGENSFFRSGRCMSCPFEPTCRSGAETVSHLSLVAGLNQGLAQRLRSLGATDIDSLKDIPEGSLHGAGLEHNLLARLSGQAQALSTGSRLRTADRTPLPGPDVELFLEIESDPTSSSPCLLGLLKRDHRKGRTGYRGVLIPKEVEESKRTIVAFLELLANQAKRASKERSKWLVFYYGSQTAERLAELGVLAGWGEQVVEEILLKALDIRSLIRRSWFLPVERYDLASVLLECLGKGPDTDPPPFVTHFAWREGDGSEAEELKQQLLLRGEESIGTLLSLWDWLRASLKDKP